MSFLFLYCQVYDIKGDEQENSSISFINSCSKIWFFYFDFSQPTPAYQRASLNPPPKRGLFLIVTVALWRNTM